MSIPQLQRETRRPRTGEVHVWEMPRHGGADTESLRTLLSHDELVRENRLRVPAARDAFVFYRATVRTILSEYLETSPGEVPLGATESGKPVLSGKLELSLSITHRADLGLLAVSRSVVGIDLEVLEAGCNYDSLAQQALGQEERLELQQLASDQRADAVLRIWALKEAYLKAVGVGLARPLGEIRVDFKSSRLLATGDPTDPADRWNLVSWLPRLGWYAAVAAVKELEPLRLIDFSTTLLKDCWASPAVIAGQ